MSLRLLNWSYYYIYRAAVTQQLFSNRVNTMRSFRNFYSAFINGLKSKQAFLIVNAMSFMLIENYIFFVDIRQLHLKRNDKNYKRIIEKVVKLSFALQNRQDII